MAVVSVSLVDINDTTYTQPQLVPVLPLASPFPAHQIGSFPHVLLSVVTDHNDVTLVGLLTFLEFVPRPCLVSLRLSLAQIPGIGQGLVPGQHEGAGPRIVSA